MDRRIRKLLKNWVIPPGFQRVIRRIKFGQSYGVTAEEAAILSRNVKSRNMYAGRRCFVIGNGPSLNKQDLTPLGDEITIVMNLFHRHPILKEWQPTFWCAAEPAETCTAGRIEYLKTVSSKVCPQAYFLPLQMKPIVEKHEIFPPEKAHYLNMTGGPVYDWPARKYALDLTRTVPGARTTAHMAIMIALYIGCSPIYLIGLDHDWLASRSVERHFYAGGADLSAYGYGTLVEMALKTWRAHEALRDVACKRDVTIYNATAGGFLDVFPRVEFETLFPATA